MMSKFATRHRFRLRILPGQIKNTCLISPGVAVVSTKLAYRSDVRHYRCQCGMVALIFSVCFLVSCNSGSQRPGPGNGHVIAYTTNTSPAFVEVRTSTDGNTWSAASGHLPSSTIPPGIGAKPDQYVLAWFDSGNTLHTAASANGATWEFQTTHGTFSVDVNSRPAVEYNFKTKSWLVAFRNAGGQVVVLPVDGPGGRAVTINGVTTSSAPGMAWLSDRFILLYKDASNRVVSLSSEKGTSWPDGPGTPITSGGQEVLTDATPYLNRTLIALWLGVTRLSSTGTLSTGNIRIYSYNAGNWELSTTLNHTDPFSRGPAVTGVSGALVVADTGRTGGTVIWRNGQQIGPLDTRTQYDISLAFGPGSTNTAVLPDLMCGPCDKCLDVLGGSLAPDYYRVCTDRSGNGQRFRCKFCDPCIGSTRFCRPTQTSDAPGFTEPAGSEPCNLCPPP